MTLRIISAPNTQKLPRFIRTLISGLLLSSGLASQCWFAKPAAAQAQTTSYCRLTPSAASQKESLRQAALKGDESAKSRYQAIVKQHADVLRQCRSRTWPQTQALWVRLYPCDARPEVMDALLDHIVNKGYNQIHVEVFYDSRVLLPANDNSTPWDSVVRERGSENVDLLANAIAKGRERGLKVYAWAFTMNFGYNYGLLPNRQDAIARNGKGESSLSQVNDGSQLFIDPYNRQAQTDYYNFVQGIAKRRPDGMLFDYIRYPRGSGSASVASKVQDLWIYGNASRQALDRRALNNSGRDLIRRFIERGYITAGDLAAVDKRYPQEGSPNWQGRTPAANSVAAVQSQLWMLTVAHAAQGVIDFLDLAARPLISAGIPAGAVFFPTANQGVGQKGYDSRLQPWDRFSPSLEWHPMAYAVCGNTQCIVDEVQRVVSKAGGRAKIMPALAGYWGRNDNNRPSLDAQMEAIRRQAPSINAVSHFAYSWQEPQSDRARRFCRL